MTGVRSRLPPWQTPSQPSKTLVAEVAAEPLTNEQVNALSSTLSERLDSLLTSVNLLQPQLSDAEKKFFGELEDIQNFIVPRKEQEIRAVQAAGQ